MLVLYCLVLIAVCMDLRSMRISNRLILIGLGIGFLQRFLNGGVTDVLKGVAFAAFPIILLYLLFLVGALGAGDIKLFSLIGGFVNFKVLTSCILYAFLCAGMYSFFKMIYCKTFFSSMQNVGIYIQNVCMGQKEMYCTVHGQKSKIHFSVFILCGLLLTQMV